MREYLKRLCAMLGPEERLVVESIATEQCDEIVIECGQRLLAGEKAYGRLDLRHDRRDFAQEIAEELLDAINYRHMDRVKRALLGLPPENLPLTLTERVMALEAENAELRAQLAEFEDCEVELALDDCDTEKPN